MVLIAAKACKACQMVKALEDFAPDKRPADGRKGVCRACVKAGNRVPQARLMECTSEGCTEKQVAKGLCAGHWQQARAGIPLRPLRLRNSSLGYLDKKFCTKCERYKGKPQFSPRYGNSLNSWCRDCERAKNRQWHVENEEKSRAQASAWQRANPERARGITELYRIRNRDRYLALARKNTRLRRARLLDVGGRGVSLEVEDRVLSLTGGLCNYCHDEATALDHFYPISKGGPDDEDNLVPACKSCNSSKRDRDPVTWITRFNKLCKVIPKQFDKELSQ